MSMVILLPNEVDGISQLLTKLKTFNLTSIEDSLQTAKVAVSLPKWKTTYSGSLNGPLTQVSCVKQKN